MATAYTETTATPIRKSLRSSFGCGRVSAATISGIANRRSQATRRSTSASAAGMISVDRLLRPKRTMPLFDQTAAHRLGDGGGAIGDAELLVEVLDVRLHGRDAEVEILGDVRQALARGDHAENLPLAVGQHRRVAGAAHADRGDEPGGQLRRQA